MAETSTTSASTGALTAGGTFDLGKKNIVPGSVTHSVTTVKEGVNFVVNYRSGEVTAVTNCADGTIAYKYRDFSRGEDNSIEETGVTTKEINYEMFLSSARVNLTDEAMLKQDGLNYNLVDRALNEAAYDIERDVDGQLHMAAMSLAPFAPAGNQATVPAGPTPAQWLSGITTAVSNTERAGYPPRYLIGSNVVVNSWTSDEAFQRDGRPDFALTPQAVIARYRGMNVISSPYWSLQTFVALMNPSHINLIINRTRPVRVQGPFQSRNSNGDVLNTKEWIVSFLYDIQSGFQRDDLGLVRVGP